MVLELEKLKQIANGECIVDSGIMVPTELLIDAINEIERLTTEVLDLEEGLIEESGTVEELDAFQRATGRFQGHDQS